MKLEDFYELRVGYTIFYNGNRKTIDYLNSCMGDNNRDICQVIGFEENVSELEWKDIHSNCSLKNPKKRYWKWYVEPFGEPWGEPDAFLDDFGRDTRNNYCFDEWDDMTKIKIKDDFIDIEEK